MNTHVFIQLVSIKNFFVEFANFSFCQEQTRENRWKTDRIPARNNECPILSTVSFQISIVENRTNNRQRNNHLTEEERCLANSQVKALFKLFLDFFYSNKISVCFAAIKSNCGSQINLSELSTWYKTPIQIYAFTMLKHVGYAIEHKLAQNPGRFADSIHRLCQQDDDKFYRLCLHLFRRATEYHFLDVSRRLIICFFFTILYLVGKRITGSK